MPDSWTEKQIQTSLQGITNFTETSISEEPSGVVVLRAEICVGASQVTDCPHRDRKGKDDSAD